MPGSGHMMLSPTTTEEVLAQLPQRIHTTASARGKPAVAEILAMDDDRAVQATIQLFAGAGPA
jgi:hypothetical protein